MSDAQRFSDDERRALVVVLDEIIPPSGDGRLPGAGRPEVVSYIERALSAMPDLWTMVTVGLAELASAARSRYGRPFPDLPRDDRAALLSEQGFVFPLTLHAYAGYYQAPTVVQALGLEARAPHPQGYTMEPNDLTLLEPVRRRGKKLFRDC